MKELLEGINESFANMLISPIDKNADVLGDADKLKVLLDDYVIEQGYTVTSKITKPILKLGDYLDMLLEFSSELKTGGDAAQACINLQAITNTLITALKQRKEKV